jgi:hypothetical protein
MSPSFYLCGIVRYVCDRCHFCGRHNRQTRAAYAGWVLRSCGSADLAYKPYAEHFTTAPNDFASLACPATLEDTAWGAVSEVVPKFVSPSCC